MSIFGSIVSKIFGHSTASAAPASPPPSATPQPTPASFNNPGPSEPAPGQSTPPAPETAPTESATTSVPASPASPTTASAPVVDVEAVLTDLASKNPQKLDWRHSIVDMMKLLGLDSSLSARQALAKELHYTGSMDDSASMNIWLHKQVMQKLAENGGKVPDDLK